LNLNFVGICVFLISCWLPGSVVGDEEDTEDVKDEDDEDPIPVLVPEEDDDGDQLGLLPP
jgi:hypothetical protein